MFSTSKIYIDRNAVLNNFNFLKMFYGPDIKLSSVIKANAYGHGIEEYVPIVEDANVSHFSVFSADEAYRVCSVKKDTTNVMIMGAIDDEAMEWVINNNIEFYVFDIERCEIAINVAKKLNKPAIIHLDIETGMHRIGLKQKELNKIVKYIKQYEQYLIVKGICTHYAGAESIANYFRINKQISNFKKVYKWLVNHGIIPEIRHTACSAASIVYPKTRMDMLRIGILQYGFWPSKETYIHYLNKNINVNKDIMQNDPLNRVISWKSEVMSIQDVSVGEFIGYGTSFLAQENMKIAIIPVGYAHGYNRSLSNQGRVLIREHICWVIGIVNMNMLMVDVTKIPYVQKGDEVVLIGSQGDLTITVSSFSDFSDQLNYELLSRLPRDIPRIVLN